MEEIIETLKRTIECTESYGLTSIKTQYEKQLINYVEELQQRIDKAIEYMNSLEFFELMNSANKEDYFKAKNKLLEILGDKERK